MSTSDEIALTILPILASALLSGLLGVLISNWHYKRNEIRRLKLKVLQQLLANRYDFHCVRFVDAINRVPVVYYESKEVLAAFKAYHEHIQGGGAAKIGHERLLDLIKAMYKHLNIDTEPLTDNILLSPFVAGTNQAEKSV
ncbi:MAG: hypothetical protein NWE95_05030 [Candidatus Bathyarchaeota archaeon]|nr:hypothetical protein [Candidatus Bathyarchaeota archaeon]